MTSEQLQHAITPTPEMSGFAPLIGMWATSGDVLDEGGAAIATISGTDAYSWMAGGHFVIHDAEVSMGPDAVTVLELIGGYDEASSSFPMRAFESSGSFGEMTAHQNEDGSWLFQGDGVRSTLRPDPGGATMAALWEMRTENPSEQWRPWMQMRFDRIAR